MWETASTAELIGGRIAAGLGRAEVAARKVLADAEREAAHFGGRELRELRETLVERIERLGVVRAELDERGGRVRGRLEEVAAELVEVPARIAAAVEPAATEAFDEGLGPGAGHPHANDEAPAHLVSLKKAADAVAEGMTAAAREEARRSSRLGEREAERIASEGRRAVTRAYAPAVKEAEAVQRHVAALTSLLSELEIAEANDPDGRDTDD